MTKMDSITQFQSEACKTFKKHRELNPDEAMLLDWVIGLPGEVGEVCELIKHHIFHGEPLSKMELAKELGDVAWYLSAIAKVTDIPLDGILGLNVSKLSHRYDNGGFDKSKSAERHAQEKKFEDTETFQQLKEYILTPNKEREYVNIVLVGNECTGKTTLATMLCKALGMQYYKGTYREDNKLSRATDLIKTAKNVIFDRLYFPDEIIYRIVKNDPLPEDELNDFMELQEAMKERNFLFIHLDALSSVVIDRLNARGDEFITSDEIYKIGEIYRHIMRDIDVPTVCIDASFDSVEEMARIALIYVDKFKRGE